MQKEYLTAKDISVMLNISYEGALHFIKYSGVEFIKIGNQYRVSARKLDAFLYPPKKKKNTLKSRPVYQIIERN